MQIALFSSRLLVVSLLLLLFNDFYLKAVWPGVISGKLSDVAGISLLSLILFAIFPKFKKISIVFVVVFFSWWKSEWSSAFIQMLHQIGLENVNRTIDYTDLFALLIIPLCYRYSLNYHIAANQSILGRLYYSIVIGASLFAIIATSQIRGSYKSEFQFENTTSDSVTSRQAREVVDRVLLYYNYKCSKFCDSNKHRRYMSTRGRIEYRYDVVTHKIYIVHSIRPDGTILVPLPQRNDIKFLTKVRKKISKGLKSEDSGIKIKITVKPDFYRPVEEPVNPPVPIPTENTMHFTEKSAKIETRHNAFLKQWANYLAVPKPKRRVIIKGFSCDYRKISSNKKLALERAQSVRKFLLYYGVMDSQMILPFSKMQLKPGKTCSAEYQKIRINLIK